MNCKSNRPDLAFEFEDKDEHEHEDEHEDGDDVAERVGFEPPVWLPVHLISRAVSASFLAC
jgi:hypothetical protein